MPFLYFRKVLTMRELQNEDMYILSEIADKIEFTLPKYPMTKNKSDEEIEIIQKDYGTQIITMLIRKIYKAKDEINKLLANVNEKSIEEISKMGIKDTILMLKTLLKQDGVLDFFK